MNYINPFFLITALLAIVFILAILTKRSAKKTCIFTAKELLTANEREFFQRLKKAVPELQVFPQVALSAFLSVRGNDPKERIRLRNKFARKYADFLITDPNCNILVLIELDDKTHIPERDKERDLMLAEAGYKTIRFQSTQKPDVNSLRNRIIQVIQTQKNKT